MHQCIKYYLKCQTRYLWGEEKLTWCVCFEFFFFLGLADAVSLGGDWVCAAACNKVTTVFWLFFQGALMSSN